MELYKKYGSAIFSLQIPLELDPNADLESQFAN